MKHLSKLVALFLIGVLFSLNLPVYASSASAISSFGDELTNEEMDHVTGEGWFVEMAFGALVGMAINYSLGSYVRSTFDAISRTGDRAYRGMAHAVSRHLSRVGHRCTSSPVCGENYW